MVMKPFETRVFRASDDGFPNVRGAKVLIYWPHGFGDFVFLSYLLPLLEPSNRYFITRWGDDNTAVFDGCAWVRPLYVGQNSAHCRDGADFGNAHFGMRKAERMGRTMRLDLPLALHEACTRERVDAVLDFPYWEVYGRTAFPFHSKGRNMLRHLVSRERLAKLDLNRALPSALNFAAPRCVRTWVEARLRSFAGWTGRKLGIVIRNGYTSAGKNWGHRWREDLPEGNRREGEECRDFLRLMRAHDPEWRFVVMEDRLFEGHDTVRDRTLNCVSYAELFGALGETGHPFALVAKALLQVAEVAVGVPAGPFHLAMAQAGVPTIGLWTEHAPSWFDEPKAASLHLVGRNVWGGEAGGRPGTFERQGELHFQIRRLDSRIIPGEAVFAAIEELLALPTRPCQTPIPAKNGATSASSDEPSCPPSFAS